MKFGSFSIPSDRKTRWMSCEERSVLSAKEGSESPKMRRDLDSSMGILRQMLLQIVYLSALLGRRTVDAWFVRSIPL